VAQRVGVTVAEITKLAWAATLRKYTRQNDIVFGQVMANRDIPVKDAETILGPLLSTVPCRVRFDDDVNVEQTLLQLQADRGAMMAHSHAGLVDIKRWSGIDGDLFDTLFMYQNMPEEFEKPNERATVMSEDFASNVQSLGYTFELIVLPNSTKLQAVASYKPMKLSHTDAQLLLNEFDHTLYMVCDIATKRGLVEKLWHLSPFQQDLIQSASTGVNMQLPYEVLHHAFEDQAQKQAHARAIEFEDKWLSYGELNAQANSLANKLSTFCVKVGDRVAVVMERCLEFPIGLLAVLKVGAAMMPIDAKFPVERIMYMLDDAKASVLITTEKFRCDFQDISIQKVYVSSHDLARDPITFAPTSSQVVTRDNEAYVVYTSGSTGKPKGVPVLHGGIVNVLSFRSANVGIAAG
ncbi:hypothetical protein As57867_006384, partial [Aphanomyces stellatus]